jgi:2-furoate---CoA ligase
MDLQHVLLATFERHPGRTAVQGPDDYTYAQLARDALRLASAFQAEGGGTGSRIATIVPNSREFVLTYVAATLIGACVVPLNTRYGFEELAYCLQDSAPVIVVTDPKYLPLADAARQGVANGYATITSVPGTDSRTHASLCELVDGCVPAELPRVGPDDAGLLLYTSGTTGKPKGVVRTHRMEFAATLSMVHQTRWTPDDVTLGAMPNYHTMGLHTILSMILFGGTYVPMAAFDAEAAVDLVSRYSISTACLIPTLYWRLVRSPGAAERLRPLRKLMVGGAPLTPGLATSIQDVIEPEVFVNWFGCTEIFSFAVEEDPVARPGSVGRPTVLTRMRVVEPDADGRLSSPRDEVPRGEVGQVIVAAARQDDAFTGYLNRPEADVKALREGWYFTGDLGRVDEDGRYWLLGRADDVIITGGENVYATEVEEAFVGCPGVAEVVVCGLPDAEWGQAVTAFVVPEAGAAPRVSADRIMAWVRAESGLTPFKRPKRVIIIESIPKSAVGKILRRQLVAGNYV